MHLHIFIFFSPKLLVVDNTMGVCYQLFRELRQKKKILYPQCRHCVFRGIQQLVKSANGGLRAIEGQLYMLTSTRGASCNPLSIFACPSCPPNSQNNGDIHSCLFATWRYSLLTRREGPGNTPSPDGEEGITFVRVPRCQKQRDGLGMLSWTEPSSGVSSLRPSFAGTSAGHSTLYIRLP